MAGLFSITAGGTQFICTQFILFRFVMHYVGHFILFVSLNLKLII